METKTSRSILERVKAAKDAQLGAQPAPSTATVAPVGLGDVIASGVGGLGNGIMPGALMGIGYGTAKGRPITGGARGAGRGALTLGGGAAGMAGGVMAAQQLGGSPKAQLLGALLGAGGGAFGGWKAADKLMGKQMKEKEARDPSGEAFASAVQDMAAGQLKGDAFRDIRNVGLTALGVGAAGRGIVGLIQHMKQNRAKKTRSGPAYLPLPYPAKTAGFLDGDGATTKGGIPWYGPAMMLGGLGGLGLGWKGMDKVLDARRQREQESELAAARQQFHDALLSQYDEPIKVHPEMLSGKKKSAADDTMVKVGEALDELYDVFQKAAAEEETRPMSKSAIDWSNVAGQAAGGYGMYAGLSGLLTGALVYDKIQKRSRRAVLEKALAKRQRRKFMQQPTEIYATPEPMPVQE